MTMFNPAGASPRLRTTPGALWVGPIHLRVADAMYRWRAGTVQRNSRGPRTTAIRTGKTFHEYGMV